MFLEVVRALMRRWYVLCLGLICTGALGYGAFVSSPPEYTSRGLVLLLPSEAAVGKGGNPFLSLSGLEQPAGILVAHFGSAPVRAEVEALSPTADYQVAIDDSTRGPVIGIGVTAKSPAEAMSTLNYLVQGIPKELDRLQEQVATPATAMIGSMSLAVDKKPDVDRSGTLRTLIAAVVVGLAGTAAAGYGIDSLIARRRMKGDDELEEADGPSWDDEVDQDGTPESAARTVPARVRTPAQPPEPEPAEEPAETSTAPEPQRVGPRS